VPAHLPSGLRGPGSDSLTGGSGVTGSNGGNPSGKAGAVAPAPTDGQKNGTETDADCGGATAPKCADGKACKDASDCESGVCGIYYWDLDGDGYGSDIGMVRSCGRQPPADTSTQGGDCCDSAAEAHPGATAYYELRNACGIYDYDCDGVEHKDRPSTAACGDSIDFASQLAGGSLSLVACR
jgi:hypothetical protein